MDDIEATNKTAASFSRLLGVIKILRSPNGCPWDKAQTPFTMRTPIIEEAYELVDAILENSTSHICEELGDLLLNTLMVSYMQEQSGDTTMASTIDTLTDKLIRRHPHVFGTDADGMAKTLASTMTTPQSVLAGWDVIKEKVEGREKTHILDEVPSTFPPTLLAYKYQKKAAKRGFDYPDAATSLQNLKSEYRELQNALDNGKKDEIEDEAGDVLFATINYLRKIGVDSTTALAHANAKFRRRFSFVEDAMQKDDVPFTQDNLEKMDAYWAKAKEGEK